MSGGRPGPVNALTDVAGLLVGHETQREPPFLTGTTVVLAPDGAVAGVDVRGGGPGTRETDALEPGRVVERVHAVVLSGGSAYGLDSAGGVVRYLEERGLGFPVGARPGEVVPVVPAAVVFDLGRGGDFRARPTAESGYRAAAAAREGPVEQGVVGAGTGAVVGALKGGVGTASLVLDSGAVVGALAVVNAAGHALDPATGVPYAAALELEGEFAGLRAPSEVAPPPAREGSPFNTTLAVVATDVALTKAQARRLAQAGQTGLARALRPAHLLVDGDVVFGLSTERRALAAAPGLETVLALDALSAAAADTLGRAVVHALLAAEPAAGLSSYRSAYPSAFAD